MLTFFRHLVPTDRSLFFSRNDRDDPRLGDVVAYDPERFPEEARVVLVGVPQDEGVRRNGGRVGAAGGPEAIRRALYRLATYDAERCRSIPRGALFDAGDIDVGGALEDVHGRLTEVVAAICDAGLVPLVIGGGHDISYPCIAGASATHGRLGALNVDAHLDVRPPVPQRNSGTSFRMAIDEELIDPSRLVQLGIQPFANAESHCRWVEEQDGRIMTLEQVRRAGVEESLTLAASIAAGHGRFYATLDIDAVRAADAPGVSATMSDGLASADLLRAARMLGEEPRCVALDIAEMNPAYDRDGITAKLAAHAVVRFVVGRVG